MKIDRGVWRGVGGQVSRYPCVFAQAAGLNGRGVARRPGEGDGAADGEGLGDADGLELGRKVGEALGLDVGLVDGLDEGLVDGLVVGRRHSESWPPPHVQQAWFAV